jgi:hypothetical protein
MPIRKTLKRGRTKVRTFRQENNKYCGPASAKMVLRWLKVTRSQNQLWDVLQDAADTLGLPLCESCEGSELCEPWSTNPEALADVLKGLGKAPIKLISERSAAATDHAIVWSLINDIPAVALVQGWAHWLVVHGYHVDRVPANIDDTGYQLLGFDVIDPWPKTPARVFVDAAEWRSDYLNGVPCGRFTGSFVAVCDPEPTRSKGGPTVPARPTTWQDPKRGGRLAGKAGGSERMLPMERARSVAIDGIERAGLTKAEVWRTAMRGTKPGAPQVVHRLDRPRQLYLMVPFEKGKTTTAQVLVDAYSGALLTARATENVKRTLAKPWSVDDAIERVARRRWDLPGARANLQVRREALSASTTLVWKPCTESLSPFMPFTRVTYGDYAFYVRIDGEVFTELTRPSPGG